MDVLPTGIVLRLTLAAPLPAEALSQLRSDAVDVLQVFGGGGFVSQTLASWSATVLTVALSVSPGFRGTFTCRPSPSLPSLVPVSGTATSSLALHTSSASPRPVLVPKAFRVFPCGGTSTLSLDIGVPVVSVGPLTDAVAVEGPGGQATVVLDARAGEGTVAVTASEADAVVTVHVKPGAFVDYYGNASVESAPVAVMCHVPQVTHGRCMQLVMCHVQGVWVRA